MKIAESETGGFVEKAMLARDPIQEVALTANLARVAIKGSLDV